MVDYPWAARQADLLSQEFPRFAIWLEPAEDSKVRYIARRLRDGINPFCVITRDPDELRAALSASRLEPPA